MNSLLITGGTGLVGRALISRLLAKGEHVIALARDKSKSESLLPKEVEIVEGDILLPECGVKEEIPQISAVYHLAGMVNLGSDKDGMIRKTNVEGTRNVINCCAKYQIPRLFFCSTAYTQGKNPYEKSKALCEVMVEESSIPKVTIFKPSIIMPELGQVSSQHFLQYVMLLIRVHRRAELIRRWLEGNMRLPIIKPAFRIRGNPGGFLNLVTVDAVADNMAAIKDDGTYWLTNPSPPTLKQVTEWVGDYIMVELEACERFDPTPLELAFGKMTKAFAPYLQGDKFHSDITASSITKEYIEESIKKLVSRE